MVLSLGLQVEENGYHRTKKYAELSAAEKIQADCDMKATNIILQGLPADIYSLVNHHRVAKDLWERVQLLMQVNTKFLNSLPPEWSKFVTNVKLVKDTSNFDQLHAYLEQHELHANEVRIMHEQNQDPLAFVANQQMTPPHFNPYQSSYNPQLQQQENLIACLNIEMAFLTAVASSRFPTTNNQLRTSSNPRNQATIQDGRVTMQQVQGRQGQNYSGTTYKSNATNSRGNTISGQAIVVKCYNCQGKGHMARQCTQPKRPRNEFQQIKLRHLWYPHNGAFQKKKTKVLDTYDSDCNDLSTAKAVLMANISNYGSDIILEVPNSVTYLNDIDNHSVHALQDFEHSPVMDFIDNEKIKELDNIICKASQSAQTVHMLTKPQVFYDNTHKQALGYQNPFYLKKAQRIKPTLYDGVVISNTYVTMHVIDDEETLILEEVSLVNASLKKPKFHLAQFDSVVKKRTTPSALKKGEMFRTDNGTNLSIRHKFREFYEMCTSRDQTSVARNPQPERGCSKGKAGLLLKRSQHEDIF
ncbi:retrovirus-related pol polyprotein from transposon TNT 1-94 [Tanacetum coccineum]